MRNRQRGVALITAVLVVALASIAAAAMLSSANLAIHRASTLSDTERAWWYADGIEAWVKSILRLDQQNSKNNIDYLGEPWAKPVDYLPVDEGALRGGIVDLQGRFNVNNLGLEGDPSNPKSEFAKQKRIFEALLQSLDLRNVPTDGLAESIHDWIDAGNVPMGSGGAEDDFYSTMQPPYRAANRRMTSVSELLAIKGMTKELYAALRKHVCALPSPSGAGQPSVSLATKINVNTATPEVLAAAAGQSPDAIKPFLDERVEKPAESVPDFWKRIGTPPDTEQRQLGLDVHTEFFLLEGEAFIGSSHLALYSVVQRPSNGLPVVISRSQDVD